MIKCIGEKLSTALKNYQVGTSCLAPFEDILKNNEFFQNGFQSKNNCENSML